MPLQVAFIIGQSFLSTLCALRWGTFVFYAAFVVVAVVFVLLFIPETKVGAEQAISRSGGAGKTPNPLSSSVKTSS